MWIEQGITILIGVLLIYGLEKLLSIRLEGDEDRINLLLQAKNVQERADHHSQAILNTLDEPAKALSTQTACHEIEPSLT